MNNNLYGYLAEFRTPEALVTAVEKISRRGYRELDAFTPFPIDELDDALPVRANPIAAIMLVAGIVGGLTGYGIQYFTAVIDYPILVGGKPMHSWPAFIPVVFELIILFAALAGFFATWWSNRLPQLHHPVFAAADFDLASRDRFFLLITANDKQFSPGETRQALRALQPHHIHTVPAPEAR